MEFQEVLENCHWIKQTTNGYDMILDHHMLSTFRNCEQYFVHNLVEGWAPKAKGPQKTPWFFAIGILVHAFIEEYYEQKELQTLDYNKLIEHSAKMWLEHEMDALYSDERGYKALGGLQGFCALVLQYCKFYDMQFERLRPIATEVSFGKKKEVFIGSFLVTKPDRMLEGVYTKTITEAIRINCFLSGRIDLLMDNGKNIGPMDHKTMESIVGNPLDKYNPQDGLTGYIFATREIMKQNFPELLDHRNINMMWVNFIGIANQSDPNKRFKRLPLFRTDWELEQYRARNIETFHRIFEMLYFNREAQWNTGACSNMFRRDCMYKPVHRQSDINSAFLIMNDLFEKKPIWNTEALDKANKGEE